MAKYDPKVDRQYIRELRAETWTELADNAEDVFHIMNVPCAPEELATNEARILYRKAEEAITRAATFLRKLGELEENTQRSKRKTKG